MLFIHENFINELYSIVHRWELLYQSNMFGTVILFLARLIDPVKKESIIRIIDVQLVFMKEGCKNETSYME